MSVESSLPAPLTSALLVIFGITGDLSQRKLLPALYHLTKDNLLPENFKIVGISRRVITPDEILAKMRQELEDTESKYDQKTLERLAANISTFTMDLTNLEEYKRLKWELDQIEDQAGVCLNRIFYLAIPSQTFGSVVDLLGEAELNTGCQHQATESRLLVEKPFGSDLSSALSLIDQLSKHFSEDQIYRIDHYLAKETAQNILTFRFYNPLFSAVWNHKTIDHIVITAAETIGIEGRAVFYEQTGALRDVIQNHLLQLLALTTMEKPKDMSAMSIHVEKLKLLKAVVPISPADVPHSSTRGQYANYKKEVKNQDSFTETFAALRLQLDNPRWKGVPLLLVTGKALSEKKTEIAVTFKDPDDPQKTGNTLIIRIEPNEGIGLFVLAKKPGFEHEIQQVHMDFRYSQSFSGIHPDAYERVLVDTIKGDRTLFATSDEVIAAWKIVDPILKAWHANSNDIEQYPEGSQGPSMLHHQTKA